MERKVKLGYSKTDYLGNWKLSDIFTQFTEVATSHAISFGGWDPKYQDMYGWIISKMRVIVHRPVRIDEEVTLKTWITEGTHVVYPRHLEVYDANGNLVIEATSNWTLLDLVKRRITMPRRVGLTYPTDLPKEGNIQMETDFSDEEGFEFVEERHVRYGDLDVNGHLNNARYVEWMCDVLGYEAFREGYMMDKFTLWLKENGKSINYRLFERFWVPNRFTFSETQFSGNCHYKKSTCHF